jgi:hypothetical protein
MDINKEGKKMNDKEKFDKLEQKIISVLCDYNDVICKYEDEIEEVTKLVVFTESFENILYIMAEHDVENEFLDRIIDEGSKIINTLILGLRKGD